MTPAISLLERHGVAFRLHQYEHDATVTQYAQEAADKMQVNAAHIFKTLVVEVDGSTLVVAMLPALARLSLKQVARVAGGKKAALAETKKVVSSTGYQLGAVSPLGQKKRLPTFIDDSACNLEQFYVSAGKRGLEIAMAPDELQRLSGAQYAPLSLGEP
ncbi:Cys-tRNA(Pro) deacylase [Lacimicrobium sp. SS2-24]|uniref:Cys-tRNA(Pro) deacylase n=1 Tax=Lacimicrobium sp. SS2-24 TaxID=2005569 RepID=UPI000B4B6051|nr:Cys-tRNA(Pro) deacylase [Lacimicrobium sp. SS2-24]